jgi:group I intron endonuclease
MKGIIYSALNTINGKRYIGQTIQTLKSRRNAHLRKSSHNEKFSQALKKYRGWFLWIVLDTGSDQEELDTKEQFWIQHYGSHLDDYGYNLQRGGQSGRHSDESKRKIGLAHKGKVVSDITRKRIRASKVGKSHFSKFNKTKKGTTLSDEHKQKCSESLRGRIISESHRDRLSQKNSQSYLVTSPSGDTTAIHGLTRFCKLNGLSQSGMSNVLSGRQSNHKGWKIKKLHKI